MISLRRKSGFFIGNNCYELFFFFRAFILKFRVLYKSKVFLFNLFMDCVFIRPRSLKVKHLKSVLYFYVALNGIENLNKKKFTFFLFKFLSLYEFHGSGLFLIFFRNLNSFCDLTLIKNFINSVLVKNRINKKTRLAALSSYKALSQSSFLKGSFKHCLKLPFKN